MIAGIDPGAAGYIALLEPTTETAELAGVYKLPRLDGRNLAELNGYVRTVLIETAFLERPGQYTKNRTTLVKQHREYAEIRAAFLLAGVPVIDVAPQDWKRYYKLTKDKQQSIKLARCVISGLPELKVKDNDLAEACLIGLYGWLEQRFTQRCLI